MGPDGENGRLLCRHSPTRHPHPPLPSPPSAHLLPSFYLCLLPSEDVYWLSVFVHYKTSSSEDVAR